MDEAPGHALVESLLTLADGTTEEIVRGTLDTGLAPALEVTFTELLPRLARTDLLDAGIVIGYHVRSEQDERSYEIHLRPSTRRPEIRAVPATPAQLTIRHGAAEFADLARALLGARHELGAAALGTSVTGHAGEVKKVAACFADSPGLAELGALYGSCMWGAPWEPTYYETCPATYRNDRIKILEIGAGGGQDKSTGGESLRMWHDYFPRALVYGMDIFDKMAIDDQRIRFFQGDQSDDAFLTWLIEQVGTPNIIIDDGSHISEHVIKTSVAKAYEP